MKITSWIFVFFTLLNFCVAGFGLSTASTISARKDIPHKNIKLVQKENIQKKEDARRKFNEISKLSLFEQSETLSLLNSPEDVALIPEWEALGKRIIHFEPKDRYSARDFLLRPVIDALAKYHNPKALSSIEAIEQELRQSSGPKEKALFTLVFMGKQQAVNPPYQIVTKEVLDAQPLMKEVYLKTEHDFENLRNSNTLTKAGENLLRQKSYEEAEQKFRQALNDPYVSADADGMEAGRGLVDALVLSGKSGEFEDWNTAIKWQKIVLRKGIGIQWINKEIIKLWKLYEFYKKESQKRNISVNSELMESNIKTDDAVKIAELEEKYNKIDDKSKMFMDLGDYYYRNLNFKKAEESFLQGIKFVKDWQAFGKPVDRDKHTEEYLFRDVLKNLYLVMGQYDQSIEQIREIKLLMASKPKDMYYSKRSEIISNEQQDHYILALQYVKEHNIPPSELKYSNSFNYSFIEIDAPDWVTWEEKYKELWPRIKDLK